LIDEEIRRLIKNAETTAHKILTESRDALDHIARALLERETLSGDEVRALLSLQTAQAGVPGTEVIDLPRGSAPAERTDGDQAGCLWASPAPPAPEILPR